MKTKLLATIIGIVFSQVLIAQHWTLEDDFPGSARDDGATFTINGIGYFGTGLTSWWAPTGDFYTFSLDNYQWDTIAPLPSGMERQYASGFNNDSLGYIFGGINDTNYLNDLWQYNPKTDSWQQLASLPDVGRAGCTQFVLGDTAYIVGGKTKNQNAIDEVWAYALHHDTWTQKSKLPQPLWRSSSIGINYINQPVAFLVFGKNEQNKYSNLLYRYDRNSDSWSVHDTFPASGRTHTSMGVFFIDLVIFGGEDSLGVRHNDFWFHDLSYPGFFQNNLQFPSSGRRGMMFFANMARFVYTTGLDTANTRLKETWVYHFPFNINEHKLQIASLVFPNPAKDVIQIECDEEYIIYDISGQQIHAGDSKTLNVKNWDRGMYFLIYKNTVSRFILH